MNYYKDINNQVFAYSDEQLTHPVVIEKLKELTEITKEDAKAITNPPLTLEQQQVAISNAIQKHLDTTAQSLRYDNMISARSYTGYTNAFQTEAQALATWASECWVVAGQIEADVKNGDRAMPTVEDVLAELPVYGA